MVAMTFEKNFLGVYKNTMSYSSEYSGGSVSSGGCSYASLGHYNQGIGMGAMAPVPSGTPSMAVQVVPTFGSPSYNTLQHGQKYPSCSGYFSISSAYSSFPNNCTRFTSRLCG